VQLSAGRPAEAADELRRALRLDPLATAAYRVLGFALVQTGKFAEAVEQWDQWSRLAAGEPSEDAQRGQVEQARAAALLLAGSGAVHG
jgi:cytochrome c-type biogenesis protein CcmH/NrfG